MTQRMVVIGGDAGGLSAATNVRDFKGASELEIVVFEKSEWISYSACGEPYYVAGIIDPFEDLLQASPAYFERHQIELRRHAEVTSIDTEARSVVVRDHARGTEAIVEWDVLVYATGARAIRLPIEGMHFRNVFEMHTLDDARAARAAVQAGDVGRAAVVGAGFVGIEMAEAFHALGIETTVIAADPHVLGRAVDHEFGVALTEQIRERGVHVELERFAEEIRGREDGRVESVVAGGLEFEADLVIMAPGTQPNVELAQAAGLRIGESGAVWVDARQQTSVPNVYAAGDCCEATHRVSGQPMNIHLGTYANRQGRVAGRVIGGADETFPGILGTAITRFEDIEISRTGLTEEQAKDAGFEPVVESFESQTTAGYWPDAERMSVRGIADRRSGRLLGAQIYGGDDAAKRIDALAMAIWNEMTVDELINADLSYAPPFSGVWDPVLVLARKLAGALERG